ncbi:IclR family transcriptional regulator C-terminal domain-containing protein [Streptomyces polyrhachis]|uniref:IclR family transcriptional regulator C-terminal domain-containing protein n=1 Tax=Streptomyces polyrhachis TaxID=1282885 RepID=A0ABW2GGI6_9ACTN
MAVKPEPTAPLASVQHAFRVLEAVSRHPDGITTTALTRTTGLTTPQLNRLLLMLRREGYVQQLTTGTYVIGESLALLTSTAERTRALEERLARALDELRESTGAAIYLSRYEDGEIKITHVSDGPTAPRVHEWVDFRSAAHATAIGKCLLLQLDAEARRDHLARHRIARLTSRTVTDESAFLATLDRHPVTVPTLDLQEYAVGTVCSAVPLTAGRAVGTLALSLPLDRAHHLRAATDALNRSAAPLLLSMAI